MTYNLPLTIMMIEGDLPVKAHNLVKEWAQLHQKELMDIWITQEFKEIAPLE